MPRLPKSPSKTDLVSLPATSSPHSRLPVNPRRKKVAPDERKRVATACNSCNIRRIKCSGHKPCQQCAAATRDCKYPEPVVKKTIPQAEYDDLTLVHKWAVEVAAEQNGHAIMPKLNREQRQRALNLLLIQVGASAALNGDTSELPGDRMQIDDDTDSGSAAHEVGRGYPGSDDGGDKPVVSDGRGKLLVDGTGTSRYLGKTSGATFLDTLREFMVYTEALTAADNVGDAPQPDKLKFLSSQGQYHTFDSLPLTLPTDDDIDPMWLPPREDMVKMLSTLRSCLQDGLPQEDTGFACGGIFFWPLEDVPTLETSLAASANLPPEQRYRWLAKYHAAFALATLLNQTEPNSRVEGQKADIYFARATKLLGDPLDIGNQFKIEDVPAMTLMALYLVENHRRDKARAFVCTAMNISVEHGANRGTSMGPVKQAQQRAFWTLYILDRWLSCLMGRPPNYPDEAMTLPLPRECCGLPSSVGLRAHVLLSQVSTYIARSSYRAGPSVDEAPDFVKKAHQKLQDWKEALPPILRLPESPIFDPFQLSALLEPVPRFGNVDRPVCMLHMAHNQLYILTVRPVFLVAVRKRVAEAFRGTTSNPAGQTAETDDTEKRAWLTHCSNLARDTISLVFTVRDLSDRMLVQDLHHLFNATLILMLHQMYEANLRSADTARVEAAIRVFEKEKSTGNRYCIDCLGVLLDLKQLLVNTLRPSLFGDYSLQDPKLGPVFRSTRQLNPGEGILASLTTPGTGANMDVDAPAFPSYGRGTNDHAAGTAGKGSPGHGPMSPVLDALARVSEKLEGWENTHDMGLYSNGSCMVDR